LVTLGCSAKGELPPTENVAMTSAAVIAVESGPLALGLIETDDPVYGPIGNVSLYTPAEPNSFPEIGNFAYGDSLAVGDLDHDAIAEIVRGVGGGGVLISNQDGVLLNPSALGFGIMPSFFRGDSIAVGDLNGDGFGDLVVGHPPDSQGTLGSVSVATSHGAPPIPTSATEGLLFPTGSALVVCDVDHDAFEDIIVAPTFQVFSGRTGEIRQLTSTNPPFNAGFDKLACADLNNDGFDDVTIAHPEGNGLGSYQVLTDPSRPPVNFFTDANRPPLDQEDEVAAGDLDGDGFAEVVVGHLPLPGPGGGPPTPGSVRIFSAPGTTPPASPTFASFVAGDKLALPLGRPLVAPVTTKGFTAFNVENIFYDPPGGATVQQYGVSYTVSSATNWQTVVKNGNVVSVGVQIGFGKDSQASVSASDQEQYEYESISGGGFSTSRTDLTAVNISGHSDVPSGLFDQFYLELGIPTTIVDFSDGRPEQVTMDHAAAKQVLLTGQQLLALAQSAPNVDDFLRSTPAITDPALLAIVKAQISANNARNILLLDPNFFTAPDGSIAPRSSSQLDAFIQANADRFPPVPVSISTISIPGIVRPNTLPIPPAPQPNNPAPTNNFTQQLSNSTSSSNSTGNGLDLQLQVSVSASIPLFTAVSAQDSEGWVFEEEYQKVVTTTTSPGTQDQVTPQMASPCLQGLVDIYYDTAFGTYLYVSHDLSFVPKPPNSDSWFAKCIGSLGSLDGTACSANADCQSQLCTNGKCAPPACAPTCANGSACGMSGPFGDCGTQNCSVGVCTEAFALMSCSLDSNCATGACVGNVCGAPACAPHCAQAAGCGVNADCNSQVCAFGACLPPACSPTCAEGAACGANGDCQTRNCVNGICAAPVCSPHCAQGSPCAQSGECGSTVCTNNACVPPPCSGHCSPGVGCGANADCESRVCTGGICQPPACSGHCNQGAFCGANADCGSAVCTNGLCAPPACSGHCAPNAACGVNADCSSLICTNNVCRAPSCSPHCSDGAACGVSSDCNSRVCTSGTCRAPACSPQCKSGAACGDNSECSSRSCNNGVCK
jgi:FG-GAP repeat